MQVTGYFLLDPRTRAVRYVGITTRDPNIRYADHINGAKRNEGDRKNPFKVNWIRSLLALGLKPEFIKQTIFDEMADALRWEIETIARLRSEGCDLTNATNGGEGNVGWVPSLKTRQRQALAKLGKKRGPHSIATRLKISLANAGQTHTPEQDRLQSERMMGKSLPLEQRLKIGNASRGRKCPHTPEQDAKQSRSIFITFLRKRLVRDILNAWEIQAA